MERNTEKGDGHDGPSPALAVPRPPLVSFVVIVGEREGDVSGQINRAVSHALPTNP